MNIYFVVSSVLCGSVKVQNFFRFRSFPPVKSYPLFPLLESCTSAASDNSHHTDRFTQADVNSNTNAVAEPLDQQFHFPIDRHLLSDFLDRVNHRGVVFPSELPGDLWIALAG